MSEAVMPRRRLGSSEVEVAALGVGTWQWGDRRFWGYGTDYGRAEIEAAYAAALEAGVNLFDTAEIYGSGDSERLLGALVRAGDKAPLVASKYTPYPTRWRERSVDEAIDRSLRRLDLNHIDLYQIHWPLGWVPPARLARALARAVRDSRVSMVGVSNFGAAGLRKMHARLAGLGVPLVSNQVQYSLLRRAPEINGVLDACHDLDVTLIAYSPLGQGVLTGKYDLQHRPGGPRRLSRGFRGGALRGALGLLGVLREIADAHEASPSQVALAWLLRDDQVLPIPGVKTAEQARANAASAGLRLDATELERLDTASSSYRRKSRLLSRVVG